MKRIIANLLFGKNSLLSGLIALGIVSLIALGCTCGKDLADLGKDDDRDSSSSPRSSKDKDSSKSTSSSTGEKPDPEEDGLVPPDKAKLKALVRETLLDFGDAVKNNDFEDFHSTVSSDLQEQFSAEKMKTAFKQFVDGKASFEAARDGEPTFSLQQVSQENGEKILEANGDYKNEPAINFQLKYLAKGNEWKLLGIKVNTDITFRKVIKGS